MINWKEDCAGRGYNMRESEKAIEVYRGEYNCAQAVCSVYGARFGLDSALAKKISCGFGAGVGRLGGICGAVTGAFMVLGLKYGMEDSARQEDKQLTYGKVREFIARFERLNGTTRCSELLGCDVSTPEGFEEAQSKKTECERFIAEAGQILEELLE